MQTTANRNEPKVQALSWLVSQLRWEETLGALRDDRFDDARDRRPPGGLSPRSEPTLSRLRTPAAVDRAIGPDVPGRGRIASAASDRGAEPSAQPLTASQR